MTDIEHPIAVHFDQCGQRQEIRAEELLDNKRLAEARALILFDGSEQVRVAPRISEKGTPHFYSKTTGIRKVFSGKKDATHDNRVQQLVKDLQSFDTWTLAQMQRIEEPNKSSKMVYDQEVRMPTYKWKHEVHRILTETAIVRHDVFGQSDELDMSVNRPWIAIEVINTHYPEEEAFKTFIDVSRRMPLLVLFDFTQFQNSFVKVEKAEKRLIYRPWTYLIRDGQLWKGTTPSKLKSAAEFRIDAEKMLDRWAKNGRARTG